MDLKHDVIKANPFIGSLDEKDYAKLIRNTSVLHLRPQEVLFHEGDFSDAFYIVIKGAIRITTVDSNRKIIFLARIGEKSFFGEQAFSLASSPRRRATAAAQTTTVLYKFPRDSLLSLKLSDQGFLRILQEQDIRYLREKLHNLASSIQQSSYPIEKITKNSQSYLTRSIIFSQDELAKTAYILVTGEIELRNYDEDKQLKNIISIGPGQIFGIEALSENGVYNYTAVVKHESIAMVIDSSEYNTMIKENPLLKELCANFNRQFPFKSKGKILQFRSEYLDMPAMTSIITLEDGRELICQQIIGLNIFLASITNMSPNREIKYTLNENFNRELSLLDSKIIGLLDYGIWEDSYKLLDLLIDSVDLSEIQLNEFSETGHISIQSANKLDYKELVCKCMRVSYRVINQLIVSQQANFSEISQLTGAGTICGACKPIILEMLGTDAWTPCNITQIIHHHPDIRSFQIQPLNRKVVPFKSGQYIVIKAKIGNVWIQRTYTLTSTPDQPYYEITVKKEHKGLFSPWLFKHANEKLIVYIAGPYGQFTLEPAKEMPIICFMGGIGITPAIAFTRYIVKALQHQRIYIDYSALHADQFILSDEFTSLTKQYKNVLINHRITSISGVLTEQEIEMTVSSIEQCHIYVCGPKGLEKLVIDTLNMIKFPKNRIHVEQFIHAGSPEDAPKMINF